MKETTKNIIQSLLDGANATTGNADTNLTDGVNSLIEGYGGGSGGGDMPIAEQSSFGGEATSGSKFYYNGVLLPEIPQDVLAEYPYCWIRKNADGVTYDLICGGYAWYFADETFYTRQSTYVWYTATLESESFVYKTSYTDNGAFTIDATKPVIWSNHDIYQVSNSIPVLYFEATEPVPEVDDASWYQIKGKTMTDFSDEARRIDGEVTTPLTPSQMLEIFANINSGSVVKDGYTVAFRDYENKLIYAVNVHKGYAVNSPEYPCKNWIDEDGNVIILPFVPVKNRVLTEDNTGNLSKLYGLYNLSPVNYPYVFLSCKASDSRLAICFCDGYELLSDGNIRAEKSVLPLKVNVLTNASLSNSPTIEELVSILQNNGNVIADSSNDYYYPILNTGYLLFTNITETINYDCEVIVIE